MKWPRTITIAWLEAQEIIASTDDVRIDLGHRPDVRTVATPMAVVWLLRGRAQDVTRARQHARTIEGAVVHTWPPDEPDPIGRAKNAVSARS